LKPVKSTHQEAEQQQKPKLRHEELSLLSPIVTAYYSNHLREWVFSTPFICIKKHVGTD
jgi:hypothetical protein